MAPRVHCRKRATPFEGDSIRLPLGETVFRLYVGNPGNAAVSPHVQRWLQTRGTQFVSSGPPEPGQDLLLFEKPVVPDVAYRIS